MAPELWVGGARYGSATDMWAVGCCLWNMVLLLHPFWRAANPSQLKQLITNVQGTVPDLLACAGIDEAHFAHLLPAGSAARDRSSRLLELAAALLTRDPALRPTAGAILQSRQLRQVLPTSMLEVGPMHAI